MILIRLEANRHTTGRMGTDDVPDEDEWHAPDADVEFTACGLACTEGGTDRTAFLKRGRLKDVTCQTCTSRVKFFKRLR